MKIVNLISSMLKRMKDKYKNMLISYIILLQLLRHYLKNEVNHKEIQ